MNYAYVTLLSSFDYLKAALVLNRNLKELNSQYPLVVLVTEDIYDQVIIYLQKENIETVKVPVLKYSLETTEKTPSQRLLNIASKMNVLNLKQYKKIVYIDIDSVFFKTVDELFDYPDGAMLEEPGENMGFAGLFVCCPEHHVLDYYMTILEHHYLWESDLLGTMWFPFKTNNDYRIPSKYFFNINRNDFKMYYPIKQKIYGLHFCAKDKPWLYNNGREYNKIFREYDPIRDELIQFYFRHYLNPLKEDYPELFV